MTHLRNGAADCLPLGADSVLPLCYRSAPCPNRIGTRGGNVDDSDEELATNLRPDLGADRRQRMGRGKEARHGQTGRLPEMLQDRAGARLQRMLQRMSPLM